MSKRAYHVLSRAAASVLTRVNARRPSWSPSTGAQVLPLEHLERRIFVAGPLAADTSGLQINMPLIDSASRPSLIAPDCPTPADTAAQENPDTTPPVDTPSPEPSTTDQEQPGTGTGSAPTTPSRQASEPEASNPASPLDQELLQLQANGLPAAPPAQPTDQTVLIGDGASDSASSAPAPDLIIASTDSAPSRHSGDLSGLLVSTLLSDDSSGDFATGGGWMVMMGDPIVPPAAPSNLAATATFPGYHKITLNWTDNSADETGFRIDRSTAPTFSSDLVTSTTTGTALQVTSGILSNITYYFRVRAYIGTDLATATYSDPATTSIKTGIYGSVPGAVTNLTTTIVSARQISLSWHNSTGPTPSSTIIDRATSSDFTTGFVRTTVPTSTTTLAATGLTPATQYYFRLWQTNSYGWSNPVDPTPAPATRALYSAPPTVDVPASAQLNTVQTAADLSVRGADDGGETNLTCTWSITSKPTGAADPLFSGATNGTHAARDLTATFSQAGTYTLTATIADDESTVTSSVDVTVEQILSSIAVTPAAKTVQNGYTQQFTATAKDQFGIALAQQPSSFDWSLDSGALGTIGSSTGLYTAPTSGSGGAIVRATSGTISGTATVTLALLPAPDGLSGTASYPGHHQIVLNWNDNSTGEDGFQVQHSTDPTFASDLVTTTVTTGHSLTISTGLTSNVTYYFRVRAYKAADYSDYSSSASVTTPKVLSYPTPATGLAASSPSSTQINLSWTNPYVLNSPSNPTSTTVDRATSSDFTTGFFRTTVTITTGAASLQVTGLSPSTTYYFRVYEINTNGWSDPAAVSTQTGNLPPTVQTPPAAQLNPNHTAADLSVLGADDGGEANLTYTWSVTAKPTGAADPVFTGATNGSNAAKNLTATFDQAGSYTFAVEIRDAAGLTTINPVTLTVPVDQVLTSIWVVPQYIVVEHSASTTFTATGRDQFGGDLTTPPTFNWSVLSGGVGGTIDSAGVYTAPSTGSGDATIQATSNGVSGTATVHVDPVLTAVIDPATVAEGGSVQLNGANSYGPNPTDPLSYAWDLDGDGLFGETGTDAAHGDETGTTPTFLAGDLDGPSSYTISLRVSDASPEPATTSATITITNTAPTPCIVDAPASVTLGSTITVSASATDPSSADTQAGFTYAWSVTRWAGTGDDWTVEEVGCGSVLSFMPAASGMYQISLTASDQDGAQSVTTRTVAVTESLWYVLLLPTSPTAPVGSWVSLGVDEGDADNDVYYRWTVVRTDESGSSIAMTDQGFWSGFTPDGPGEYQVILHAYNADGYQGVMDTQRIDVSGSLGAQANSVSLVGDTLNVEGNADANTISVVVSGAHPDHYAVDVDGHVTEYLITSVKNVNILGLEGNDTITVGMGVTGVKVDGGLGNDVITDGDEANFLRGDDGADTIYGGDGNDTIMGNTGDDRLFGQDGADQIQAGLGYDSLTGGLGNDKLYAGDQMDTVYGNEGDDYIEGRGKADTISAGDGNDTVYGGAGSDSIQGGAGDDSIYAATAIADTTPAFSDSLFGDDGRDSLCGSGGSDSISGGNGDDTLIGGAGSDALLGGTGCDHYDFGDATGSEQDTITEGAPRSSDLSDTDTLDFSLVTTATTVNLNGGLQSTSTCIATMTGRTVNVPSVSPYSYVENIIGSSAADTLTGNAFTTSIIGNGGNDNIDAQLSHRGVTILGGDGGDTITGGANDDRLDGGAGADSITAGSGDDTLIGGDGNDSLVGGNGSDCYQFGDVNTKDQAGNTVPETDLITETAGGGTDILDLSLSQYDADADLASVSPAAAQFAGGNIKIAGMRSRTIVVPPYQPGLPTDNVYVKNLENIIGSNWDTGADSTFTGNERTTMVIGSNGRDIIHCQASHQAVFISGRGGNDTITASGYANPITGAAYSDTVDGGAGDDEINGDDTAASSGGDDLLFGGDGNDTIRGYRGNDTINGGDGDDTLYGNGGDDPIDGGLGHDTVDGLAGHNLIIASDGNDSCPGTELTTPTDTVIGENAPDPDVLSAVGGTAGNNGVISVNGTSSSDTIVIAFVAASSRLYCSVDDGTSTTVTWYTRSTNTSIVVSAGAGDDNITVNSTAPLGVTIDAGAGNDTITGGSYGDSIIGGDGDDLIMARQGTDSAVGGAGHDVFSSRDAGLDDVQGLNEYYVSIDADDANAGTSTAAPWRKIEHALQIALPGDTININGVYAAGGSTATATYDLGANTQVQISKPNITLQGYNHVGSTDTPAGDTSFVRPRIHLDYMLGETTWASTIEVGLPATNARLLYLDVSGGYYAIKILNNDSHSGQFVGATNVLIEHCTVHDSSNDLIKLTPGCDHPMIRSNMIFNSGLWWQDGHACDEPNAEGIDAVNVDNAFVEYNTIHDIASNGLYFKGRSQNTMVRANYIYNIGVIGLGPNSTGQYNGFSGIGFGQDSDFATFDAGLNINDYFESIDGAAVNNIVASCGGAGILVWAAKNTSVLGNTLVDVGMRSRAGIQILSQNHDIETKDSQGRTVTITLNRSSTNVIIRNNIIRMKAGVSGPQGEAGMPIISVRYDDGDGLAEAWPTVSNNVYCVPDQNAFVRFEDQRSYPLSGFYTYYTIDQFDNNHDDPAHPGVRIHVDPLGRDLPLDNSNNDRQSTSLDPEIETSNSVQLSDNRTVLYYLLPGSPCLAAGADLRQARPATLYGPDSVLVTDDYAKQSRLQVPDIGALQYYDYANG